MNATLLTLLDKYAKTPNEKGAAQAAREAVNAATLDDLRLAAREFRTESDVIELVASAQKGARDEGLWEVIAETRTLLAGPTPQSVADAQAAINTLLEINPNNAMAIDCQLALYGPYSGAKPDEVLALTKRYIELEPSSIRAISYHAKALSRFRSRDAAMQFLAGIRRDKALLGARDELAFEIGVLEAEIQAPSDIETWP